MRRRFGEADASPTLPWRQKEKATRPSEIEVTNGSNAAAMICRPESKIEQST
jgi:hypothetical protein